MKSRQSILSFFTHFLIYNLCFLGLQFLFIYSQYSNLVSSKKLPMQVYYQIAQTVCVHIGLYILLSMLQTWLISGILKRFWFKCYALQAELAIWCLTVLFILSANVYFFPLSLFSKLFCPPIPPDFIALAFYISSILLVILLVNGLLFRIKVYLLLMAFITIPALFSLMNQKHNLQISIPSQPNILVLGIDSLSPESINKSNMPFLYDLLNESIKFSNSISPLARTYPAWCTILTGLYSKHHHAEENLVAASLVYNKASIIWDLNKRGYTTIYATDDRRFNNLDRDFGFQQIIGPQTGIADFILGSYNDFPLGNLLINTQLGSLLFPYNYANRASFFSYYPFTFNSQLKNALSHLQRNKPVFLAVHFALPHWPYAFAISSPDEVNNEFSLTKRDILYQKALKQVDQQLRDIYSYLETNNYFSNSIIVLLSDHGEALYYPNSRLTNSLNYQNSSKSILEEYFKHKTATLLNKSAGHGSDLLSPRQYHHVLAFKIYKKAQKITSNHTINTRVALIDLAPTILEFINQTSSLKRDGISLLPNILNPELALPERTFFLESGMFPNQKFSMKKAINLGNKIYAINPATTRLELKSNELTQINNNKLYGVIRGDWIFVVYPNDSNYIPVIQNLVTGQWVDTLNSNYAKSTPANQLILEIQHFYGKALIYPIP